MASSARAREDPSGPRQPGIAFSAGEAPLEDVLGVGRACLRLVPSCSPMALTVMPFVPRVWISCSTRAIRSGENTRSALTSGVQTRFASLDRCDLGRFVVRFRLFGGFPRPYEGLSLPVVAATEVSVCDPRLRSARSRQQ